MSKLTPFFYAQTLHAKGSRWLIIDCDNYVAVEFIVRLPIIIVRQWDELILRLDRVLSLRLPISCLIAIACY